MDNTGDWERKRGSEDTSGEWYTDRLQQIAGRGWKRFVPDPYRLHIRRLNLGRMLDVGCGIGRCLAFNDGIGVGVDHNPTSVEVCRKRGFVAFTPAEFDSIDHGPFDSLLLSHVLEHTAPEQSTEIFHRYLPLVRPGGTVVVITPQPAGQRSDSTHVRYLSREALHTELTSVGAVDIRTRSFPFPPVVGQIFRYNENIAVGQIPTAA
ncbi:MAG: class I SAM-dependent methyltransferase [Acidimicrobiales bacterium]